MSRRGGEVARGNEVVREQTSAVELLSTPAPAEVFASSTSVAAALAVLPASLAVRAICCLESIFAV